SRPAGSDPGSYTLEWDEPPVLALVQPADQPPAHMLEVARAAEAAGLTEVWLWEDCFAASGLGAAAALLGGTERLSVGIGLMPTPLRAPSLTAMEIATLAEIFPGRFLPGMGHGVQDWMAQIGQRADSPITLLREQLAAIGALLDGEEVNTDGRYVHLDRVRLRFPPRVRPPLLVGGRGPRTLALGGELGDGLILDDAAPEGRADAARVREAVGIAADARDRGGRSGPLEVVVFLPTRPGATAREIADQAAVLGEAGATRVAPFAGGVDGPPAGGDEVRAFVDVLAEANRL
ncbi:MAG: LLM class flavin-dependent oxidoreductase, partial [Micrococcales bacterium]|nr:LLM class flavin-dependent oxidoreductase [Micrococcales bacterium]